jgi:translation initiation factor 2A
MTTCILFYFLTEESGLFSGQGSKASQASTKTTSNNPPAQKPAAYRPPHAKNAAAVQAEV